MAATTTATPVAPRTPRATSSGPSLHALNSVVTVAIRTAIREGGAAHRCAASVAAAVAAVLHNRGDNPPRGESSASPEAEVPPATNTGTRKSKRRRRKKPAADVTMPDAAEAPAPSARAAAPSAPASTRTASAAEASPSASSNALVLASSSSGTQQGLFGNPADARTSVFSAPRSDLFDGSWRRNAGELSMPGPFQLGSCDNAFVKAAAQEQRLGQIVAKNKKDFNVARANGYTLEKLTGSGRTRRWLLNPPSPWWSGDPG